MSDVLTASMLTAIERMGKRTVTASEVGMNHGAFLALAKRGYVDVDEGSPNIYRPTGRALALFELLTAPVEFSPEDTPVKRIQRAVAGHYKVELEQMWGRKRAARYVVPRQVAMYLCRELVSTPCANPKYRLPISLPSLGQRFGGRDHTTVLSALRQVEKKMATDSKFAAQVASLKRALAE